MNVLLEARKSNSDVFPSFYAIYVWYNEKFKLQLHLTLVVSNSVDSNFRLSRIFIEVPNIVVYKYI
jgi:hypothetical protein